MTIDKAIMKFIDYAQEWDENAPNKRWYVGITKRDPEIRKKEHETKKGIICQHFKSLITCPDKDTAQKLEKELQEYGFAKTTKELLTETLSGKVPHHVYIYRVREMK